MDEAILRKFSDVPVMWEPKEESGKIKKKFIMKIENKYNVQLSDYWDLHKWSIENLPQFWEELWEFVGIIYSKPHHKVIDIDVPMYESIEWFEGARMNFAENLLKYRDNHIAIISTGEDRETERVTYAEMYEEVKLYAAALRKLGVKKGDRVACFMSNLKEAVFAMLGTTSIGAIWLGATTWMGPQAVLNRFNLVQPRILFTVDKHFYEGEEIEILSKVKEIVNGLPLLEKVIVVPSKPESRLKDISGIRNSCFLDDFLETGKNLDGSAPEIVFEQVSLTHPVFIIYTSGTTGLPKAIIHGSGGLLSMSRDFLLHTYSDRKSCWLSVSTVGWITWAKDIFCFFLGATVVLFEGSPYLLSPTYLWDLVDEFQITNLSLRPHVLDDLEKEEYLPKERNHLTSLKMIKSGSSVVKPHNYDFVYKKIKKDVIYSSIFGFTELMGSCMTLDDTLCIRRGEITAPSLGIDISCVDAAGKPVLGKLGELVISKPIPSFPLGIWGDTDRSIFKKIYFEKYPGKFAIGDLATMNPITGGIIIQGRSDDTLNPKGWRFGSSDVYNIVDTFPEVQDSLCVSQYKKNREERVVLFVKMRNGYRFGDNLARKIKAAIAEGFDFKSVPEVVLETEDVPRNINGKKMEILVKRIINKMPYSIETVKNPECLKNFVDVPELRGF